MKCSLGISNFREEIASLSHSVVFLYFYALITEKALFSLLAILWNSAFKWEYLSFSPLLFASLLFTAICKASSDNQVAFLHLLLLFWVIPQKFLNEKKPKNFPLGLYWQCNHWNFSSFLPFLILLYFQCIIYPSPIMISIIKLKKKKTKPAIQHLSFQLVRY